MVIILQYVQIENHYYYISIISQLKILKRGTPFYGVLRFTGSQRVGHD